MSVNGRSASADRYGFSGRSGFHPPREDERAALAKVAAIRRDLINPTLRSRGGNVFKTMGDGVLIEFPNVEDAVSWTIEFQEAMAKRNLQHPEKPILVRAGIALADVYIDGNDRSGAAIAYLVRLQEVAPSGGIAMTHSVRWQLGKGLVARFTRVTKTLKGMDEPWEIWVWPSSASAGLATPALDPPRRVDREDRHPPLPDKPSLAVLPFQNLSRDPDQEYFADGIVEEIITALSRVRSFFVIARNSSFTYKGKSVDVKQVGRELGVRYVLEGSVRRAAGKVRVTCQLIEAETNIHIWADRFEVDTSGYFRSSGPRDGECGRNHRAESAACGDRASTTEADAEFGSLRFISPCTSASLHIRKERPRRKSRASLPRPRGGAELCAGQSDGGSQLRLQARAALGNG